MARVVRAVLELAEPTDVWHVLPAEMAGTLRMEAAASVAEMTAAIRSEVTEYSLPLDDAYASTLGRAVRHAVGTFIGVRARSPADRPLPAPPGG